METVETAGKTGTDRLEPGLFEHPEHVETILRLVRQPTGLTSGKKPAGDSRGVTLSSGKLDINADCSIVGDGTGNEVAAVGNTDRRPVHAKRLSVVTLAELE